MEDADTRRRFEELRQYDTPAKQSARKAAERRRLKRAAQMSGFTSIVQLANALLAGTHEVVAARTRP